MNFVGSVALWVPCSSASATLASRLRPSLSLSDACTSFPQLSSPVHSYSLVSSDLPVLLNVSRSRRPSLIPEAGSRPLERFHLEGAMFEFPFIAYAHFRPLPITLSTCLVLYQLRHLRLFYQSTSHILCHTEAVAAASADHCARWWISFPLPLVSVVHQLSFMPFAGYHPHWNNPEFIVKLGGVSIVVRHTVWTSLDFYSV